MEFWLNAISKNIPIDETETIIDVVATLEGCNGYARSPAHLMYGYKLLLV